MIFKALICLKTRNAIIISPHPSAKACTIAAAKVVLDAAVKAGAPTEIIGWIDMPSLELTNTVMRYNAAEIPIKMGTFSQYQYPHALARDAELGRFVGCAGQTDEEVFENFIAKLEDLKEKIDIKKTIKDYGIDEKYRK